MYDRDVATDFGSCIRNWRLAAGTTQRELARRAGMDYTYLSKIEAGLVLPPSEEKIRALMEALCRGPEDLEILLGLARDTKLPADIVNAALIRHPQVGALLRRIKDRPLSADEAATIDKMARRGASGEASKGQDGESAHP
jgi:HTH-type transcriptional regulator, competence development regulator